MSSRNARRRLALRLLLIAALLPALAAPSAAQSVEDVGDVVVALDDGRTDTAGKRSMRVHRSAFVAASFTGVVFEGTADVPEALEGAVRFEEDGGWSDWEDLYVVPSATDAFFMAAYRSDRVRSGTRFEVRFATAGGRVDVRGAAVFDGRRDADRHADASKSIYSFPPLQDGLVTPPRLVARGAWGAAPFRGTPAPLARPNYTAITFHHAAGYSASNLEDGKEQVRRIQDFHQNGRGWSDIGYQFVVDKAGNVYQGRPFLTEATTLEEVPRLALGAHAGGANTGNIGVCLLGCYHPPEGTGCTDVIAPAALDSMATLFAFLAERYDVPADRIFGHRDFSSTACPGDNNYALLDDLRARVATLLREGNGPIGQAVFTAEIDASGAVRLDWYFVEDNGITGYRVERLYAGDTTDVAAGEGALPTQTVDNDLPWAGRATYRLFARDEGGRERLLAVAEVDVAVPNAYALTESYPNPFRGAAVIRYFLQREGRVRLEVADAAGRRVATLADGFREGGRWHAVRLDGAGLPSGVYVYRLHVEGFSGTDYEASRTLVHIR